MVKSSIMSGPTDAWDTGTPDEPNNNNLLSGSPRDKSKGSWAAHGSTRIAHLRHRTTLFCVWDCRVVCQTVIPTACIDNPLLDVFFTVIQIKFCRSLWLSSHFKSTKIHEINRTYLSEADNSAVDVLLIVHAGRKWQRWRTMYTHRRPYVVWYTLRNDLRSWLVRGVGQLGVYAWGGEGAKPFCGYLNM